MRVLRDLAAWLRDTKVAGVLVGGVAVSLLGRPRTTRDVDVLVLIEEQQWQSFLEAGARFGFHARRPDCLAFARKARVLLVRHEETAIDVDIVLGLLPFEREIVDRGCWKDIAGVSVPLPTAEDLIIMKVVAQRPRDWDDIVSIVEACPDLDRDHILANVAAVAEALETPALLARIKRVLAGTSERGVTPFE